MNLDKIFSRTSVLGVCGNRSTGKTSLVLSSLLDTKKKYPDINMVVMGIEDSLHDLMDKNDIEILHSKMDILDLKMKDTIIYVAEFALFFDTSSRSKQLTKLMRFFDRIEHNNCKLIIDTAREGYFNKFFCSRVQTFLVKMIEYDALVNGTWLKDKVRAITSNSDYRLDCDVSQYYYVSNGTDLTSVHEFKYNNVVDSKKDNVNLFVKKKVKQKEKK